MCSIVSACGGSSASTASSATSTSTPVSNGNSTPVVSAPALPGAGVPTNWKLVWADEFDRSGLPDASKWMFDTERNKAGWYNNEAQYYAKDRLENSMVENGLLTITARKEQLSAAPDFGGQAYTSARLLTRGKASWTYGYFEIRAKLPCGLGTWPAIWTLGSKGVWPDDGEIDIMEHVGKNKGKILGSAYSAFYNWPSGTGNTKETVVNDACDAFHIYQLFWNQEQVAIGVDNKYYFQFINPKNGDYKKWPFDQPQYLILNLAIGGDLGGTVDDSIFPSKFEIDYVRVYQP
ncbi:glycoside hydrolase family 16 protein [Undibacterium sp. LX15W]|uniref:Glycoside hydrolase family 16 protein n=2 Tax=Undibacterium flavidum TaxID=2762297 RepID=A0ABR6YA78_9BURK|nr:glycoside hydrolase family 16 protein [Undibacterium flavidum]